MKNKDRAKKAEKIIRAAYGDDPETDIRDLLSDIMHLCNQRDYDFSDQLRVATDNFNSEVINLEFSN